MIKTNDKHRISNYIYSYCIVGIILLILMCSNSVYAAYIDGKVILETDVESAEEGCTILGVEGTFNTDAQSALDEINRIRLEACQEGVIDPYTHKPLTEADYKPLKWSTSLEKIARIRAVEENLSYDFVGPGHFRMNAGDPLGVKYGGITSWAENMAFTNGTNMMIAGIQMWKAEKDAYVNDKSGVTGHYESLISTKYNYVGLGDFSSRSGVSASVCVSAEFSKEEGSLGNGMLSECKNIIQKVEVHNQFISGYYLSANNEMQAGDSQMLVPRAKLRFDGKEESLLVIDTVSYSSSDTSVAVVDENGVITALKDGTTTITAVSDGKLFQDFVLTVGCVHAYVYEKNADGTQVITCSLCGQLIKNVSPANDIGFQLRDISAKMKYTGSFSGGSLQADGTGPGPTRILEIGDELELIVGTKDGDDGYLDFVIETSNPNVLTVTRPERCAVNTNWKYAMQSQLVAKSTGVVRVTMYPKYNPTRKIIVSLNIGEKGTLDLSDSSRLSVIFPNAPYTYNGNPLEPKPTIFYDDVKISYGIFSISYENNTDVGMATCVITANSEKTLFTGTGRGEFSIGPKSLERASIMLDSTVFECDGTAKEPGVTVYCDKQTLVKEKDYTVEYLDNAQIGTATVKITGINNYSGEVSETFTIVHRVHSYGMPVVITEPTCTQNGTQKEVCKYCSKERESTIYRTGHIPDFQTNWTDDYYFCKVTVKCKTCGTLLRSEITATASPEVKKEANCFETGIKLWTASIVYSGEAVIFTKEQVIDITHDLITSQNANGTHNAKCKKCSYEAVSEPCYGGKAFCDKKAICKICQSAYGEIDLTNHEEMTLYSRKVAATCEEDGVQERYICFKCGYIEGGETIKSSGHKWDDGYVPYPPTTSYASYRLYRCMNPGCQESYTEILTKLGNDGADKSDGTDKTDGSNQNGEADKTDGFNQNGVADITDETVPNMQLKKQIITVSKATKKPLIYKASKLKKKKATFKIGAKAKTSLSYKISKYPKNARKYISVSRKGVVTLKKGCKKGIYKVTVTAKENQTYSKAQKIITIKVK